MLLNIDLFTLSYCYQQALADFETSTIQRGLNSIGYILLVSIPALLPKTSTDEHLQKS